MKTYKLNAYGENYTVSPIIERYENNKTLAISLVADTGEPFSNLTVNIMDSMIWASDDTAFVDTNHCDWAEDFITQNGLGEPVGIIGRSGFCTYPLYKFNLERLA